MFWPAMVCAYVFISLVLGLLFHLAEWFDGPSHPRPAELVVFFLVFSVLGVPLVLGTLFFTRFAITPRSQISNALRAKEISPS